MYVSNIKVYKHKIVQPHIPLIHSHIPLSFVILDYSTYLSKCLVWMVDYRGNLFLNQLAKKTHKDWWKNCVNLTVDILIRCIMASYYSIRVWSHEKKKSILTFFFISIVFFNEMDKNVISLLVAFQNIPVQI